MTLATPRVAVAAAYHETNTFAPKATDIGAFRRRWFVGEELRSAFSDTRTVVGGFLDGAAAAGLEIVPVFGAFATPAGTVTRDAFDEIARTLGTALEAAGQVDGVLLELHGAMAVDGMTDPEDDLVALVRDHVGRVPIAAVLDLHANVARPRLEGVDVLLGYRTNPHVDTYERGRDAAARLGDVLRGRLDPIRAHRGVPIVAAPVAQRTDAEPLASLWQHARRLEADLGLADVTIHGGYAYADVEHLGIGITVTADRARADVAHRAATELAASAWAARQRFSVAVPSTADAFDDAARGPGLVAVADTGDNINGGAPGDATWLLEQALASPSLATLTTVSDPDAVAAAFEVGTGGRLRISLGGRSSPSAGSPVAVDAEVIRVGDGTFTNKGPMATGAVVSMGRSAVLRVGRCDVVLQERPVQPNDPELFRCMGVEPADYRVVMLKGAAAIRAGWNGLAARFVDAGTPGVTDTRLERLEYHRAGPLWPLTDVERVV